jgi:hypothetical protein
MSFSGFEVTVERDDVKGTFEGRENEGWGSSKVGIEGDTKARELGALEAAGPVDAWMDVYRRKNFFRRGRRYES